MDPLSRLFNGLFAEFGHRQRAPVDGMHQGKPKNYSRTEQEEQGG
jgi:hypothetical protein